MATVEFHAPIRSIQGKLLDGSTFYIRMNRKGTLFTQSCPKRTKPPTEKQLAARKAFAEKYARRNRPSGDAVS